jgi:hypothetical protein
LEKREAFSIKSKFRGQLPFLGEFNPLIRAMSRLWTVSARMILRKREEEMWMPCKPFFKRESVFGHIYSAMLQSACRSYGGATEVKSCMGGENLL